MKRAKSHDIQDAAGSKSDSFTRKDVSDAELTVPILRLPLFISSETSSEYTRIQHATLTIYLSAPARSNMTTMSTEFCRNRSTLTTLL